MNKHKSEDVPVLRVKDPDVAKWLDPTGTLQAAGLIEVQELGKLKKELSDKDAEIDRLRNKLLDLEEVKGKTQEVWADALEEAVKAAFGKKLHELSVADVQGNPWLKILLEAYYPPAP